MSTWTISPAVSDACRERYGSASLALHLGRGSSFVCKRHDGPGAALVEFGTDVDSQALTTTGKERHHGNH